MSEPHKIKTDGTEFYAHLVYVRLRDGKGRVKTKELVPGSVLLDYNAAGDLCGIEILTHSAVSIWEEKKHQP